MASCYASLPLIRVFFSNPRGDYRLFAEGILRRPPVRRPHSSMVFSRRMNNISAIPQTEVSKSKKTRATEFENREGDDIDEDAFEALFSQLEEDLKKDESFSGDEDDEITEDDLARLEKELEEALGDEESDEFLKDLPSKSNSLNDYNDEEELPPKLKNWQLRRLAHALKIGRRKTSIKDLSAELGLERAYVLEQFREPPPNLLIMCASLPNEVAKKSEPVREALAVVSDVSDSQNVPKAEVLPVHFRQIRRSMQKRLKKVHLETLEKVYALTKHLTVSMNEMVTSYRNSFGGLSF